MRSGANGAQPLQKLVMYSFRESGGIVRWAIWDVLAKSPASVVCFGLKWDKEEFLGWKEASGKRNAYFIEGDFSSAITGMQSRFAAG